MHLGLRLDPHSHLSTEIQLAHPSQGGVEILLVASHYRNRDKSGLIAHLACIQTLHFTYRLIV